MKNTVSLKKNYQFRHVYNKGKSIANKLLVMYYLPNYKDFNQLGLSVSKKVGKSVVRSRVTRLIKESYRLKEADVKKGYDIIFIARSVCSEASYKAVESAVCHLLKKQKILKSEE